MSEKPVHSRLRRLVDWINLTGAKKVHSLIDKVYKRKNPLFGDDVNTWLLGIPVESSANRKLSRNGLPGTCSAVPLAPASLPALLVRMRSELVGVGWLEVGRLFEDIQKRSRAKDSVVLRIAHPFHNARTFESLDGALRGRKRDRQFVRHAFCSDERIWPQEFDYPQRVVA